MPIPELYKSVIESLRTGTREGKVKWQSSPKQDEFFVSLDESSVFISKDREIAVPEATLFRPVFGTVKPRKAAITIKLGDEKGGVVDDFSIDQDDPDFSVANALYADAGRNARKIDERLKKVTEQLDRLVKSSA